MTAHKPGLGIQASSGHCRRCKRRRLGVNKKVICQTEYGNRHEYKLWLCRECDKTIAIGDTISYGWGRNIVVGFPPQEYDNEEVQL